VIYTKDIEGLLASFESLDAHRKLMEDSIQDAGKVTQYCTVCDGFRSMSITEDNGKWRDLRGQFVCEECRFGGRHRLLYDAFIAAADPAKTKDVLIFEKVTHFYELVANTYRKVTGVEYGGDDLKPGQTFKFRDKKIQHEDMQNLSFRRNNWDLVIHAEVLEHVPDPWKGMCEIHRILRKGGQCIFGTPIFTRLDHITRATLDDKGDIVWTKGPSFHGDPLREGGAPVFTEFGLNIIPDIEAIGFDCSIGIDHSMIKGYSSNNNHYRIGHMWPVVVKCIKR